MQEHSVAVDLVNNLGQTVYELYKQNYTDDKIKYLGEIGEMIYTEGKSLHNSIQLNVASNVSYITAMLDCVKAMDDLVYDESILGRKRLNIIIAHGGNTWVKVSSASIKIQNSMKLELEEIGGCLFTKLAEKMLHLKKQQLLHRKPKQIVFYFSSGVIEEIRLKLTSMGIVVVTNLSDIVTPPKFYPEYMLDISALFALVSYTTNYANADTNFTNKYRNMELKHSLEDPVKAKLNDIIESGAKLYVCQTAFDYFQLYVKQMGGDKEKERAIEILDVIECVPDNVSDKIASIPADDIYYDIYPASNGNYHRDITIFGTTHSKNMCIITTNYQLTKIIHEKDIDMKVHMIKFYGLSEMVIVK